MEIFSRETRDETRPSRAGRRFFLYGTCVSSLRRFDASRLFYNVTRAFAFVRDAFAFARRVARFVAFASRRVGGGIRASQILPRAFEARDAFVRDASRVVSLSNGVHDFRIAVGGGGARAFEIAGHGVAFAAYSPLGHISQVEVLGQPKVQAVAARLGRSPAQVAMRWLVQQGIPVVTGTANPAHAKEALDLFGWRLSDRDMRELAAIV